MARPSVPNVRDPNVGLLRPAMFAGGWSVFDAMPDGLEVVDDVIPRRLDISPKKPPELNIGWSFPTANVRDTSPNAVNPLGSEDDNGVSCCSRCR